MTGGLTFFVEHAILTTDATEIQFDRIDLTIPSTVYDHPGNYRNDPLARHEPNFRPSRFSRVGDGQHVPPI